MLIIDINSIVYGVDISVVHFRPLYLIEKTLKKPTFYGPNREGRGRVDHVPCPLKMCSFFTVKNAKYSET